MQFSRLFLLGIIFNYCNGYNVLVVFPVPSKSHSILGDGFVKHLIDAGHEVTYITPFVKNVIHPKLKIIDVSNNQKLFAEINIKMIMDKMVNFQDTEFINKFLIDISSQTMENSNVQKLIRDSNQTFDIVINEWMFSDLYSVFGAVFNCPFIWFSTIEPHWTILKKIDGSTNPAYTNSYHVNYVHPLSFMNRVHELWTQIDTMLRDRFKVYYREEQVYQRVVVPALKEKGISVPSYETLIYNASLVLGNSQVVIGEAIALPQSYKHIGGYHIKEEIEPLPENVKSILDNAKHGVIYFSMGSNAKSKDLPTELKQNILEVFGSLKQTVLWKFEDKLSNVPKNVHIVQWVPQQSVLAHQNLVLFITHGGLLSLTEAVYFGVPVVVIPIFADQFANALRVEKKGFGKKIDLTYTMHNDLKITIDEILNNPKYTKRVKEISLAYHDRPITPKEELLFWVNHVVRTRGAEHLRSPALQLPLYQRLYLDFIALILVLIMIIKKIVSGFFTMFIVKMHKKEKRS